MAVSLAWLVLLAVLPVASVFLYLLVGENRLGSRRARRYAVLTKDLEAEALRLWTQRGHPAQHIDPEFASIAEYGTAVSGLPPLRGNRLTLLPDNESMLAALLRDIDAAREHVHLLYYIWMPDAGGREVARALERAVRRGVQVRVLVDGVGGAPLLRSPLADELRAAGVRLVEALPARLWRIPLARVDLRNHRKIAVFDGRVAYCGSQNIHDATFRARRWRNTGPWLDASVRVEGPAAQALAVTFLRDWALDSDEDITRCAPFLPELPAEGEGGAGSGCTVQVIPSGPGPTPQAIHQALLTTIYTAREEIVMTTPYFVPDPALLEALLAAATRGVRVTLVVPEVSDSPLVAAAGRSYYLDLLEAGVEVWHYQGALLHAKTVTMDRDFGMIGSANMDQRSFFLNFEATLMIFDDDFASAMRFMQVGYRERSRQIFLDEWRRRSVLLRLWENTAQLLGPLL